MVQRPKSIRMSYLDSMCRSNCWIAGRSYSWNQEIVPFIKGFETRIIDSIHGSKIIPAKRDVFFGAYTDFRRALTARLEWWKGMGIESKQHYLNAINSGGIINGSTLEVAVGSTPTANLRLEHGRVLEHPALAGYMAARIQKVLQKWANFISSSNQNSELRDQYTREAVVIRSPSGESGGHVDQHPEGVWPIAVE